MIMMIGHASTAMSGIQSRAAILNARFALKDLKYLMRYIGRRRICLLMRLRLRDGGRIITRIMKEADADTRRKENDYD